MRSRTGAADRTPNIRDQFLFDVVSRVARTPTSHVALRGSLAANVQGWIARSAEDIDLVCDSPSEVDLDLLHGLKVNSLICQIIEGPTRLDFGRPGIEVIAASAIATDGEREHFEFGVDVGSKELAYDLASSPDQAFSLIAPEWLLVEKLHLIQRRFAGSGSLCDVRARDVIDVLRWAPVPMRAATLKEAAAALLEPELLRSITQALAAQSYPRFWLAEWRKARSSSRGALQFATIAEGWEAITRQVMEPFYD